MSSYGFRSPPAKRAPSPRTNVASASVALHTGVYPVQGNRGGRLSIPVLHSWRRQTSVFETVTTSSPLCRDAVIETCSPQEFHGGDGLPSVTDSAATLIGRPL